MERLTNKSPCLNCNSDRQIGNPNVWQTDCYRCEKMPNWKSMVIDRLSKIEDVLGDNYNLDRLRELIKADREGRIAVFPCKPSDVTVYQLRNKKHALGMGVHPRHVGCAKVWCNGKYELLHGGDVPCKDKDFGKTWFLKEDEAQAALKAMKEREENDCT